MRCAPRCAAVGRRFIMLLSTVVRLPSSECPAGRQSPLSPHSRSSHKWCDAAPVEEFAVSVDLCVNHRLPEEAQRAVADIHRISQRLRRLLQPRGRRTGVHYLKVFVEDDLCQGHQRRTGAKPTSPACGRRGWQAASRAATARPLRHTIALRN